MADNNDPDPFDALLSLEDEYYSEGLALGVKDGSKAGRTEGRLFGMQKGFEKFSTMGALAAQAALWEARMSMSPANKETAQTKAHSIAPIAPNERLRKHIASLMALTDLDTADTNNTEEAVNDFDESLKRAESKAKVISSVLGEQAKGNVKPADNSSGPAKAKKASSNDNLEDFTLPRHLR